MPHLMGRYVSEPIQLQRGYQLIISDLFIDLIFSSIGMGTYLGEMTKEEDDRIENAIYNSVKSGAVNVLDTAINYRAMLSERNIGRALKRLIDDDLISRDRSIHKYEKWLHYQRW